MNNKQAKLQLSLLEILGQKNLFLKAFPEQDPMHEIFCDSSPPHEKI